MVRQKPVRGFEVDRRELYVTPVIAETLRGGSLSSDFPNVLADMSVARYAAGYLVSVAVPFREGIKADFERLDGVDEVWSFCFRKPRPGWRMLGRFLWRERFIGLRLYNRHDLAGKKYADAIQRVISDWAEIFGSEQPMRATTAADYFDQVYHDVNEER